MKCSNGGIVASLRARAPSFIIPSDEVSVNRGLPDPRRVEVMGGDLASAIEGSRCDRSGCL